MQKVRCYHISFLIFLQIDFIYRETVRSERFSSKAICEMLLFLRLIPSICISSSVNGQRFKNRWYSSKEKSNLYKDSLPFSDIYFRDLNFSFRACFRFRLAFEFYRFNTCHLQHLRYCHFRYT